MAIHDFCDGLRRRDFLRAGALGTLGLTLADHLRLSAAGELGRSGGGKATAAIFVNLGGGPSHLDSFDPKPEAPDDHRGEFAAIETATPGMLLSEHLPKLALESDKFVVVRGVSHTLAAHDLGTKYMNTGNRPLPSLEFPGYGSVVSKELGGPPELPPFVAIPNTPQVPGYLGVRYAPLSTTATPRPGQPFTVRGISLGRGVTIEEIEKRKNLLKSLDRTFEGFERDSSLVEGLDEFSERAHRIISSPKAREAFDVSKESRSIARLFGTTPFSQSCLLAARLVEAGVRFATVSLGGWDTHQDNFNRLRDRLLPDLDAGIAGLLRALDAKGLLETTAVLVTGEFGRTPKINRTAGRDHYPRAMTVLMAGGGTRGGQVVGASDEKGTAPASGSGFSPDDVAASFYHALGIDHQKEYQTPTGRPVAIARHGNVIRELFS